MMMIGGYERGDYVRGVRADTPRRVLSAWRRTERNAYTEIASRHALLSLSLSSSLSRGVVVVTNSTLRTTTRTQTVCLTLRLRPLTNHLDPWHMCQKPAPYKSTLAEIWLRFLASINSTQLNFIIKQARGPKEKKTKQKIRT